MIRGLCGQTALAGIAQHGLSWGEACLTLPPPRPAPSPPSARSTRPTARHDIDVAILSQRSLEDTLNVLLEKVTERLRVDTAVVALIEPETHELVYAARLGLDDDARVGGPALLRG